MAGTRAYRRDSHGKFAGSGGGSMTTYGKAGGFANASFRARASAGNARPAKGGQRAGLRKSLHRAIGAPNSMKRRQTTGKVIGTAAAFAALGVAARAGNPNARISVGSRIRS